MEKKGKYDYEMLTNATRHLHGMEPPKSGLKTIGEPGEIKCLFKNFWGQAKKRKEKKGLKVTALAIFKPELATC